MALDADPYRTLGLERGASLDDVKRAYRRLAKANHPDAAGESALPRFLAIQAAYDQIAGPDARTRRPGAAGGRAGSGAAGRPWEADPDRAGATNRAYGGRPRSRPGPRPRPAPGGPSPGARASRPPRPERPPNKATLGSTSYDGAEAEPLDPDWGGASWYGTSSGTYWTLNPKEYADPRKHGPEYQARARRADERRTTTTNPPSETLAADGEPATVAADPEPEPAPVAPDPEPEPAPVTPDAEATPATPAAPTHTASSWWQPTSARPADASAAAPPPPPGRPRSSEAPTAADGPDVSTEAVLDAIRSWLDDRRPGVGARVGRAVAGWAPIALGIGWAAGEATGCSRFSAACPPAVAPLIWVGQVAVLVLLILVPRLARVTTVATIATLAAVLPASALLLATSDAASMDTARAVLGGLMTIAWVAGVVFGAAREFRRRPIDRPVS